MVELRKDWNLLLDATECLREMNAESDLATFFMIPENRMLISGENVGIAKQECPGIYIVHWYFKARGREAINLGKEMVQKLFDECGAITVIAVIKRYLKASRWACRQLGFKSQGFIIYEDGDDCEILFMTKEQSNG